VTRLEPDGLALRGERRLCSAAPRSAAAAV